MKSQTTYSWIFYLFSFQSFIAFWWLFSIPSDDGRISPARFMLFAILLFISAFWIYFGYRPPGNLNRFTRPSYIKGIAVLSLLLYLVLLLLRLLAPDRLLPIYERLSPLFWYLIVLTAQIAFFLIYLRRGADVSSQSWFKSVYVNALFALLILTGVLVLVVRTRLGITFDPAYWAEPGVPIPAWLFITALIFGAIIFILIDSLGSARRNLTLVIFIYVFAAGLWLSTPVEVLKNSYYMPITAPDFLTYPYSDSIYYDRLAQSVLVGHPYQGEIPSRPLYISFLTILHLLFGQEYAGIITGQTLVLALIPVLFYLLGRKLHSPSAGVIIALLFIFREWTSLLISSKTRVTNTKMLLVDLPTLMILLISCLAAFAWLEKRRPVYAYLAGGIFGVVLLLRIQSLLILPFLFLLAIFIMGLQTRMVYLHLPLFIAGLLISIAPWLTHNYLQTGKLSIESAGQATLLVSQYTGSLSTLNDAGGESNVASILIQRLISDPGSVIGFVANHFMAIQVNGMLVFPINEEYPGLFAPMNLYWMQWERGNVTLDRTSMVLIYLYLVVISLGVGSVWKRWRWLGLLPLSYSIGYAVATALSRYSGWRYDFPSDWVWYFYFGIGFSEILTQVSALLGTSTSVPASSQSKPSSRPALQTYLVAAAFFLFIGGLPWAIKTVSLPRYADQSPSTLLLRLASVKDSPSQDELKGFIETPGSFLQTGRLLYPRYFSSNKGLSSANPSPAYAVRDYPRLGFYLLNQEFTAIVLPMETMPGPVPHASDVIVLGCQRDGYVEARLLVFPNEQLLFSGTTLSEPCSP